MQHIIKKHPEVCKKINRKWYRTHPEQVKIIHKENTARRRKLGFDPLNEPFDNSEAHHIDFECVIYIPYKLHHSVRHCLETGRNMELFNAKVFEWLEQQRVMV